MSSHSKDIHVCRRRTRSLALSSFGRRVESSCLHVSDRSSSGTGEADAKMTCIWLPCPAPLSLRRGYDPLVDGHAVPIHLPLLPSIMLVSISYHRRLFGRCDAVLIMLAVAGNLRLVRPSVCMHFTAAPKPMPFSIEAASHPLASLCNQLHI